MKRIEAQKQNVPFIQEWRTTNKRYDFNRLGSFAIKKFFQQRDTVTDTRYVDWRTRTMKLNRKRMKKKTGLLPS